MVATVPVLPNPATNREIGLVTGGADVCNEIVGLLGNVYSYDQGSLVAYAPVPNGLTTYNSNSFTYTLLSDVGLGTFFTSFVSWSPGWGQLVPGLH